MQIIERFCFVFLLLVSNFCVSSYGSDRYVHYARDMQDSECYLDTQSIACTDDPNVFRCWDMVVISEVGRKNLIASNSRDAKYRKVIENIHDEKKYIEINFIQNTFRIIEALSYDEKGNVINRYKNKNSSLEDWGNIPPDSLIESLRNMLVAILHDSKYGTIPQQPFIDYQIQEDEQENERKKESEAIEIVVGDGLKFSSPQEPIEYEKFRNMILRDNIFVPHDELE